MMGNRARGSFTACLKDPCLKPLAELIASVPVHFTGSTLTADDLCKEVKQMGSLAISKRDGAGHPS